MTVSTSDAATVADKVGLGLSVGALGARRWRRAPGLTLCPPLCPDPVGDHALLPAGHRAERGHPGPGLRCVCPCGLRSPWPHPRDWPRPWSWPRPLTRPFVPGHLESKSSIKRVLAITTVLSLAYSVTQVRGRGRAPGGLGVHCLRSWVGGVRGEPSGRQVQGLRHSMPKESPASRVLGASDSDPTKLDLLFQQAAGQLCGYPLRAGPEGPLLVGDHRLGARCGREQAGAGGGGP